MTETILYDYWRSSASYRIRIALNLTGIPYRSVPIDLVKGEQKSPEHMALNPQGLVPVLMIDGQKFTQSLAILEYLNDTRDLGLLPGDPILATKTRALAQSVAVDVHPVCNLGVLAHITALLPGVSTARTDWMRTFITPGLHAFESLLSDFKTAQYCAGDTPSMADICLIPQLYNARRWEVDFSDCPRICAVETACAEHPAFRAAYPNTVQPV